MTKQKKELRVNIDEKLLKEMKERAEENGVSLSRQVELILSSTSSNGDLNQKILGRIWLNEMPEEEFEKLVQTIRRKKKRIPKIQPYLEEIFQRNPKTPADSVYKLLEERFGMLPTGKVRKFVQKIKKRVRENGRNLATK